jgi:hypothetical protein
MVVKEIFIQPSSGKEKLGNFTSIYFRHAEA